MADDLYQMEAIRFSPSVSVEVLADTRPWVVNEIELIIYGKKCHSMILQSFHKEKFLFSRKHFVL